MVPITNLIIRLQPYPQRLKDICMANPTLSKALKNTNPKKFISLGAISISYPPETSDEVIGFYVYDYGAKTPLFKQDFIVNIGSKNTDFIIYTRFPSGTENKIIKDINDFFEKYPTYDRNSHRPTFEELPDGIKPRALQAIALAEKLTALGLREEISEEEYAWYDSEFKKLGL